MALLCHGFALLRLELRADVQEFVVEVLYCGVCVRGVIW